MKKKKPKKKIDSCYFYIDKVIGKKKMSKIVKGHFVYGER